MTSRLLELAHYGAAEALELEDELETLYFDSHASSKTTRGTAQSDSGNVSKKCTRR